MTWWPLLPSLSKPKPLTYYKRYGKDESTGFPKDVFLWQTFHGNKEALEAAIANGSVQEYKKDGVQFYSFQKSKTGVESGTNNDLKVDRWTSRIISTKPCPGPSLPWLWNWTIPRKRSFAMAQVHPSLGQNYGEEDTKLFSGIPKLHSWLHSVLSSNFCNPKLTWCFR